MKKSIILTTALMIGVSIITSCSSNDHEQNEEDGMTVIEKIALRHSDNIDAAILHGAWTEIGYVDVVGGKVQDKGQNDEYARYRFCIIDGNTLTQYITYPWASSSRAIKLVRKYQYDSDSRQFFIENNHLDNIKYVIDYLDAEYMTMTYTFNDITSKRVLKRVAEDEAMVWEDSYRPEVRGSISDYGIYQGEDGEWHLTDGTDPFSTSQFHGIIVGHPLKCVEMHEILDDGSISEFDYNYVYIGGGVDEFLFDENTVKLISQNTSSPECGPWIRHEYSYTYDEADNQVSGSSPSPTLLSYDEEKDWVMMILRPHHVFAIYQRMPMSWWTELEALTTKVD